MDTSRAVTRFDLSPTQQAELDSLLAMVRCLACPNESIHHSRSPFAVQLRHELIVQTSQDVPRAEQEAWLVQTYGTEILYRPPLSAHTLFLWSLPILALVVGVVVIIRWGLRHRPKEMTKETIKKTAEEGNK